MDDNSSLKGTSESSELPSSTMYICYSAMQFPKQNQNISHGNPFNFTAYVLYKMVTFQSVPPVQLTWTQIFKTQQQTNTWILDGFHSPCKTCMHSIRRMYTISLVFPKAFTIPYYELRNSQ